MTRNITAPSSFLLSPPPPPPPSHVKEVSCKNQISHYTAKLCHPTSSRYGRDPSRQECDIKISHINFHYNESLNLSIRTLYYKVSIFGSTSPTQPDTVTQSHSHTVTQSQVLQYFQLIIEVLSFKK